MSEGFERNSTTDENYCDGRTPLLEIAIRDGGNFRIGMRSGATFEAVSIKRMRDNWLHCHLGNRQIAPTAPTVRDAAWLNIRETEVELIAEIVPPEDEFCDGEAAAEQDEPRQVVETNQSA